MQQKKPALLIILDGFGISEESTYNAIQQARTPQWDEWWQKYPHTLLDASGKSVGLPGGQMGNSEVGHMHIGAGRTILQSYTAINEAIKNGDLEKNAVLQDALTDIKQHNSALHLMGLLSDGGVHSHQDHLFALLKICAKQQINKVYLHLFLDGRDTSPRSAKASIDKLEKIIQETNTGTIASICGRYYAMDRDKRWERVEPVYKLLTSGEAQHSYSTAEQALDELYAQDLSDEFIPPTRINNPPGINPEDSVLFFNFRADRARELSQAFIDPKFSEFPRDKNFQSLNFLSMTEYSANLSTKVIFPPVEHTNTLGEVIAKHNLTQLRIAETEKYAHVTFFLNGGREVKFHGEDRTLIPSPKVSTYDLQPEMCAEQVTKDIVAAIDANKYDVIVCNYANADMVGHTGNFKAAVQAVEALDKCLAKLGEKVLAHHGEMLITADHGNVECMFDEGTQQPHTAHTSELVPLLYVGAKDLKFKEKTAHLSDIAPTFLQLLDIKPPKEMTGESLWDNID